LKEEILTIGPVVGGLMFLKNFNQAFTKVNGGVYLENVTNYGSGRPVTFGKHPEWNGNHAVSIMGWGLAKDIKVSNDDIADVPYWVCRNTRISPFLEVQIGVKMDTLRLQCIHIIKFIFKTSHFRRRIWANHKQWSCYM
jgi:hypothetical protein